jgi:IMP dehydrogenase
VGDKGLKRTEALIDAECDLIVDRYRAWPFSKMVSPLFRTVRNSPTGAGRRGQCRHRRSARALIDAGRGLRQGRHRAGLDLHHARRRRRRRAAADGDHGRCRSRRQAGVPVIADGGSHQGDVAKALAAGAAA